MFHSALIAGLLAATMLGNSPRPESNANRHKTDGTWRLISVEWQGEMWQPAPEVAPHWIIRGNQLTMRPGQSPAENLTVKWDASSTPATVDVVDGDKTTLRGIYQITGQRLILCAGGDGRPTDFVPKPRRDQRRIVLERE